ncbi:MAG: arsenate reductase ArsC [Candidatus Binataceae bacterium]
MSDKVYNVLFLCAENSARSIMAEAILQRWGKNRFRAFSAGISPLGQVHPLAEELLKLDDLWTEDLRSKGVDEFRAPAAPQMDFVIALCDRRAEVCPVWPGGFISATWGISDPAGVTGTIVERKHAFRRAFRELENRIRLFVLLRHEKFEPTAQTAQQGMAV